jgi:hypothetical protein
MNRSSRRPNAALAAVCVALLAAVLAVPAGAATVHFQKESLRAYQGQLHHGEVHALTFHPASGTGHIHISLNDGRHMTVTYASGEQAKLVAQAQAANTRVTVATVKAKKAAPVKHKLRYYVGGALIAVILVVLVVLLIGRRRTLAQEGGETSRESASSQ